MKSIYAPLILPVRFEHDLAQELDVAREKTNMSRNAFVIEAVRAALDAQPELKFRVAELAMRELIALVVAAEDGGVINAKAARQLRQAIHDAKRDISIPESPRVGRWDETSPHGLALLATEPLRDFVNKFNMLCLPRETQTGRGGRAKKDNGKR